jgi:hypothetical protein
VLTPKKIAAHALPRYVVVNPAILRAGYELAVRGRLSLSTRVLSVSSSHRRRRPHGRP